MSKNSDNNNNNEEKEEDYIRTQDNIKEYNE